MQLCHIYQMMNDKAQNCGDCGRSYQSGHKAFCNREDIKRKRKTPIIVPRDCSSIKVEKSRNPDFSEWVGLCPMCLTVFELNKIDDLERHVHGHSEEDKFMWGLSTINLRHRSLILNPTFKTCKERIHERLRLRDQKVCYMGENCIHLPK